MAHWHNFNPWADTLVYIPSLEEWASANANLGKYCDCSSVGGSSRELMTIEWLIKHALNNARIEQGTQNPKVDAYILPQPDGNHSMGLRIGPEGSQYQSPPCNPIVAERLIQKYRNPGAP